MGAPRIVVAVASHRPYPAPRDPAYLPVHVGRALHPELAAEMDALGYVGDDTGDSVSSRNAELCELTALWWVWRNVEADYKGLVHYRRHLGSPSLVRRLSRDRMGRFATGEELAGILGPGGADAVLPRRRDYYVETVRSHWEHTLPAEQLEAARAVVGERDASDLEALDAVLSSRGAHMFNMMVMRSDLLDEYCSWLFPALHELGSRLPPSGYDPFNARYLGRVSEVLLDAWLLGRDLRVRELPTVSPEPVDWVAKGSAFLAAKFLGRKYGGSF